MAAVKEASHRDSARVLDVGSTAEIDERAAAVHRRGGRVNAEQKVSV